MQLHLISPFFLKRAQLRSAHSTGLDGTKAVVFQSNCVQRTCSKFLHRSNCLGRGSNPYPPRYRPSALTDRPTMPPMCFYVCMHVHKQVCTYASMYVCMYPSKYLVWCLISTSQKHCMFGYLSDCEFKRCI